MEENDFTTTSKISPEVGRAVPPCSHEVLWFGLCSGPVPVRQPDPELLLPQRGSDRPETSRDGVNHSLAASPFQ